MPKSPVEINLDQPGWGVGEIAKYTGMLKSNVRKTMERAGIKPWSEPAIGPVWRKTDIVRWWEKRSRDTERVAADSQRRETARATARARV